MKPLLASILFAAFAFPSFAANTDIKNRPLNKFKMITLNAEAQKGLALAVILIDENGNTGEAKWSGDVTPEFLAAAKQKLTTLKFKPYAGYASQLKGYAQKLRKLQKQKCASIDPEKFKQWDRYNISPSYSSDTTLMDCLNQVSSEQALTTVKIPSFAKIFFISEQQILNKVANIPTPKYPAASLENGEEGRVIIGVRASSNRPHTVRIIKGSGYHRLDDATLQSLRDISFFSKMQEGIEYYQLVNFSLE